MQSNKNDLMYCPRLNGDVDENTVIVSKSQELLRRKRKNRNDDFGSVSTSLLLTFAVFGFSAVALSSCLWSWQHTLTAMLVVINVLISDY